jgi:hypothetical protein
VDSSSSSFRPGPEQRTPAPAKDLVLLADLLLDHELADGGERVGEGLRLGLLLRAVAAG